MDYLRDDPDLAGLRIHTFPYESPKLRWPMSPARIPDYNDIAQSLPGYLATHAPGTTPIAVVTHSQGGLILQRFMAWMLAEGRGRELARFRLAVMLSCPNEGTQYLRSIRAVVGLSHHPQAGQLDVLDREVRETRRIVLRQVVNATSIDDRHCPIPVYVYSGRTNNVVRRESAQSVFPNAEVLPGDHFSILNPDAPGHLTAPILKRRLLDALTPHSWPGDPPAAERTATDVDTGTVDAAMGARVLGHMPVLPPRFVGRENVSGSVRDDLLSHRIVALVGMGGAGKTVLATAMASDFVIRRAFADGIAWVNVGQRPTPTQLQEQLVTRLSSTPASFATIEAGQHRLAELLAGRSCLLLVDDVWDLDPLRALHAVGPNGAILFTTRDAGIARAIGATVHQVDSLTLEQALELLGRWCDTEVDRLPPAADALCIHVGKLALAVAIVGGMIKSRGARPNDWRDVAELLTSTDVDALADAYGPDYYQHASLLASLTVSIDDLTPADRDRYRDLAAFRGRGAFPLSAVSALWESAGCTLYDSSRLLARFADRSLVQRDDQGWTTLHDLQFAVAAHQLATRPGSIPGVHVRLVDGYRRRCGFVATQPSSADFEGEAAVWVGGPDDGYFFQNLAYHLSRAGQSSELDSLLMKLGWLDRKLRIAGIRDLIADYTYQARPRHVDLVHAALLLSAHVLSTDQDLLRGQLVGRLLNRHEPCIGALLDAATSWDERPWLRPLSESSLAAPGGPLERILEGHTSSVAAVAAAPDGARVVSGGHDNTLRVWNLGSGQLEFSLKGHASSVEAVAITSDGGRIISGGRDNTLRVWNLASGRLERTIQAHAYVVGAVGATADGRFIVSGGDDNMVRVWDVTTGRLERTLKGHTALIAAVAITSDSQAIVSGSFDNTVRVWDLASGQLKRTLEGHESYVEAVAVAPDDRHIFSSGDDNTICVWDLATGQLERTLKGHTDDVRQV